MVILDRIHQQHACQRVDGRLIDNSGDVEQSSSVLSSHSGLRCCSDWSSTCADRSESTGLDKFSSEDFFELGDAGSSSDKLWASVFLLLSTQADRLDWFAFHNGVHPIKSGD